MLHAYLIGRKRDKLMMRSCISEQLHIPPKMFGQLLFFNWLDMCLQNLIISIIQRNLYKFLSFPHTRITIIKKSSEWQNHNIQFYKTMAQTPFDSLLRRQKERRVQLINKIDKKDLKKRSESYNLTIQSTAQDPEGDRHKERQKVSFSNSIKKSYYCRKFMNRTVEGHVTSQEFCRFKEKIGVQFIDQSQGKDKLRKGHQQENKLSRKSQRREGRGQGSLQIWGHAAEEKQNKNKQGQPVLVFERSVEKSDKVQKIENIYEIAQRRKNCLDFDLEVQGNKKSIRIKDMFSSKSPKRKPSQFYDEGNGGSLTPEIQPSNHIELNFAPKIRFQKSKQPCTFFQRFKQKHYHRSENHQQHQGLLVNKIRYNLDKLHQISDPNSWTYERSNTGDVRVVDTPYRLRREIRSSWDSTSDNKRFTKIGGTAQPSRLPIRRVQKQHKLNFTNDINGWNVKNDNEDEEELVFGR